MAKGRSKGGSKRREGGPRNTRNTRATVERQCNKAIALKTSWRTRRTVSASLAGSGSEHRCRWSTPRGLRPTPDRVRETLFNWIEHFIPALEPVRGLDFFAGTGALGFELASRGARQVTLIESNRQLVEQLSEIKRKLAADQIDIVAGDALAAAGAWPEASFEIIFIDPPFDSGLLPPALAAAARLIVPNGLMYAESDEELDETLLERHRLQIVAGKPSRARALLFAASVFCIIAGQP